MKMKRNKTHLLNFTPAKTPIRSHWLFQPKIFLQNPIPLVCIPLKPGMVAQKLSHHFPPNLLNFRKMLYGHASFSGVLGSFSMKSIDEFFKFVDVGFFSKAGASCVFAVAVAMGFVFFLGS